MSAIDTQWSSIFTAKIQRHHRIWIPKPIREQLQLSEGEYVEVMIRRWRKSGLLRK